tara:strand:- start:26 stop:271 length:246 start_codon:yes stop_codon:yes gene_type:complete
MKYAITKDMSKAQRLAVIKRFAKKYNKKVIVRDYTEKYADHTLKGVRDDININAYTDGAKYLDEHYGDRVRETKEYESEWN